MVEFQPSKLAMRVRFPSSAYGPLAQQVEHHLEAVGVAGSIPAGAIYHHNKAIWSVSCGMKDNHS